MAGRSITVEPYDRQWAENFQQQAAYLRHVLADELVDIHHIGSTAVRGLAAKPVIDMLLAVRDLSALERFNPALKQLGYQPRGENGIAGRRYFTKGGDRRTHHLHAFVAGSEHIIRHLAFRDYLRRHATVMAQYAQLKYAAARACGNDAAAYSQRKNEFIATHQLRAMEEWDNSVDSCYSESGTFR